MFFLRRLSYFLGVIFFALFVCKQTPYLGLGNRKLIQQIIPISPNINGPSATVAFFFCCGRHRYILVVPAIPYEVSTAVLSSFKVKGSAPFPEGSPPLHLHCLVFDGHLPVDVKTLNHPQKQLFTQTVFFGKKKREPRIVIEVELFFVKISMTWIKGACVGSSFLG